MEAVKGDAPNWPSVDPERLRSWADVETWEELDYMIVAISGMAKVNLMIMAWDPRAASKAGLA